MHRRSFRGPTLTGAFAWVVSTCLTLIAPGPASAQEAPPPQPAPAPAAAVQTTLDLAPKPGVEVVLVSMPDGTSVPDERVVFEQATEGTPHVVRYVFTNRGAAPRSVLMLHPRYTKEAKDALPGVPADKTAGGAIDLVTTWSAGFLPFQVQVRELEVPVTRVVRKVSGGSVVKGLLIKPTEASQLTLDRAVARGDVVRVEAPAELKDKLWNVERVLANGAIELQKGAEGLPENAEGLTYVVERQGTFKNLIQADPTFTRVSEAALPLTYVWPDPATDDSPVYLEKRYEAGAHPYELKLTVTFHNFGSDPVRYLYGVRVSAWQHPTSGNEGGMFSVPKGIYAASCFTGESLETEQIMSLTEQVVEGHNDPSQPKFFAFPTHTQWASVDTQYFTIALATRDPQRFSCMLDAYLLSAGYGAIARATLWTNSKPTLKGAPNTCLPSWHRGREGNLSCADAATRLGQPADATLKDLNAAFQQKQLTLSGAELQQLTEAWTSIEARSSDRVSMTAFMGAKDTAFLEASGHNLLEARDFGILGFISNGMHSLLAWFYGVFGTWALAIVFLTILVKGLLLPLTNKSFKAMQHMQKLKPEMDKLKEKFGDDKQKMNAEMMSMYKRYGVNPLSGCLPMVLQMPIWIALYQMIRTTVELYHAPLGGWIHDLSSPDPYFIMPVVLAGLMLVQNHFVSATGTATGMQAKLLKWGMPLMFGAFMLFLPSGLVLYILVNTILTIAQNIFIRRRMA